MTLKMDKELSLEELGLYSIMLSVPEAKEVSAEYLANFSAKDSYKKVLKLLKGLLDKGYVVKKNGVYCAVPEKAKEIINE